MLPSLKERLTGILRDKNRSCDEAHPGAYVYHQEGHGGLTEEEQVNALLSLLNERTDEVVKVLRVAIEGKMGVWVDPTSADQKLNWFNAGVKESLSAFDTASLLLKPDEERE